MARDMLGGRFHFFVLFGGGEGEFEAQGRGGGLGFLLRIPGGGGGSRSRGGGVEGHGGCLCGIWEGGGG